MPPHPASTRTEAPPTAGLPMRLLDWWPWGKRAPLRPPGIDEAQLECSGTASLVVALTALKTLSSRRTVIVPAYTCPLVPLAIAHCGLTVRLCDTRLDHFDMEQAHLEHLCGGDTLAIVPTHLGGRIADVEHALTCARRVGAWVIEDAAQAWGAILDGGASVGLRGDIGFFSLAVGKGITTYEGGMLVAREADMRDRLRRASRETVPSDWRKEGLRYLQLLGYTALYRRHALRLSYGVPRRRALARGDWVHAVGDDFSTHVPVHRVSAWRRRIGERAAVRWPEYAARLKEQAAKRLPKLQALPHVTVVGDDSASRLGTWPFFMLLLPDQATRDAVLADLAPSPLGVSRLFVHALPDYDYLRFCIETTDVPHARRFAATMLTVSNSLWLSDDAFAELMQRLRTILIHTHGR